MFFFHPRPPAPRHPPLSGCLRMHGEVTGDDSCRTPPGRHPLPVAPFPCPPDRRALWFRDAGESPPVRLSGRSNPSIRPSLRGSGIMMPRMPSAVPVRLFFPLLAAGRSGRGAPPWAASPCAAGRPAPSVPRSPGGRRMVVHRFPRAGPVRCWPLRPWGGPARWSSCGADVPFTPPRHTPCPDASAVLRTTGPPPWWPGRASVPCFFVVCVDRWKHAFPGGLVGVSSIFAIRSVTTFSARPPWGRRAAGSGEAEDWGDRIVQRDSF